MPSLSNVRLPSAFKYNFDVRIKGSGPLFYPSCLDIGALARFFSCIVFFQQTTIRTDLTVNDPNPKGIKRQVAREQSERGQLEL